LLTKEQQRNIRKNLKEYSKVFDEEDANMETLVSAEALAQRKRAIDEWNAWRAACKAELSAQGKLTRKAAPVEEQDKEEIEEWIEEVIETIEEVVEE
jgi:translation initiation factor 3 subunit B